MTPMSLYLNLAPSQTTLSRSLYQLYVRTLSEPVLHNLGGWQGCNFTVKGVIFMFRGFMSLVSKCKLYSLCFKYIYVKFHFMYSQYTSSLILRII